ncbi:MAG: GerMN domain-containing protein [Candidatus Hydrogenedentota bacterium]
MSEEYRGRIVRNILLSVWALLTLVLLFALLLLANEMVREGRDPLMLLRGDAATAKTDGEAASRPRPAASRGSREVNLYFARKDGLGLTTEARRIDVTASTAENCRAALEELGKGPSRVSAPIFPAETTVRALYLLQDGELVIDFSRDLHADTAQENSVSLEALMVYGIVNTLTQQELGGEDEPPVRRVRFLIEGAAPREGYPAHLDLSKAFVANRDWAQAR